MERTTRFNRIYFAIAFFGVLALHDPWVRTQAVAPLP